VVHLARPESQARAIRKQPLELPQKKAESREEQKRTGTKKSRKGQALTLRDLQRSCEAEKDGHSV
jgi:hypothetical protein